MGEKSKLGWFISCYHNYHAGWADQWRPCSRAHVQQSHYSCLHVLSLGSKTREVANSIAHINRNTFEVCMFCIIENKAFIIILRTFKLYYSAPVLFYTCRYQKRYPARKTRIHHKATRVSQDHGFFEDNEAKSIKSMPTSRTIQKRTGPSGRVSYLINTRVWISSLAACRVAWSYNKALYQVQ